MPVLPIPSFVGLSLAVPDVSESTSHQQFTSCVPFCSVRMECKKKTIREKNAQEYVFCICVPLERRYTDHHSVPVQSILVISNLPRSIKTFSADGPFSKFSNYGDTIFILVLKSGCLHNLKASQTSQVDDTTLDLQCFPRTKNRVGCLPQTTEWYTSIAVIILLKIMEIGIAFCAMLAQCL